MKKLNTLKDLQNYPTGKYWVKELADLDPNYICTEWTNSKHKKRNLLTKLGTIVILCIYLAAGYFIYYGLKTGCQGPESGHYFKCKEL